MKSIVSKGKDINQAIISGLSLLETTKDGVTIEIIQNESKGFLGIGCKEGIVRLTKLDKTIKEDIVSKVPKIPENPLKNNENPVAENIETSNELDLLAGKVWVKNGYLYCKSSPTYYPMVTVTNGVKLFKNGQPIIEGLVILSEQDSYEIKTENEDKETKWSISMDDQRLKVLLNVEPGYKVTKKIVDHEPDNHIELRVEEVRRVENTLSYAEVLHELESLHVTHGLNQAEIIKAIGVTSPSIFEIATGIKSKPGKDGWVEIKVDMSASEELKENEEGRIDFREIKRIPSVERGQLIGIVHPPISGEMGYTVMGEPLPVKQTSPIMLKTGKGVSVVENKIIATQSGRPVIETRGHCFNVAIMQKLIHEGNVDLASGNIRFTGDVEIRGEVKEGMKINAEGELIIHQTVNMATLTSTGAIISKGTIIGSEVSAGKNYLIINELGQILANLHHQITNLIFVIEQLSTSTAFKSSDLSQAGIQPLIRLLVEKKFQDLPNIAKKYIEIVKMSENYLQNEEWKELAVIINKLFLSLTNEVTSLETITGLSRKMEDLIKINNTLVESHSYITVSNSLNSRLYCSGNILITDKGCVNSKVHAGGTLKINGILRGGEVYGRLGVEINEAGAKSGTSTLIAVPDDQKIYINKIMEGSSIKIGNQKYIFEETRYHVKARLDKDGKIVIQ
ncbi:flagellar assembly protein A [Ferdinandcohnia quinoae]|uniref:FapA family protein n=1 Tax=Fredinandcohnia quinoae TaxID=2918902 RepID=A0AAW5E198_9BACI|nr:flagellar assembly protein A [Fredinandcohnia sp. SECRCQ15]MCH1625055.1 FapA family protein [Fredinandcohnia sp. SECRCQ15]